MVKILLPRHSSSNIPSIIYRGAANPFVLPTCASGEGREGKEQNTASQGIIFSFLRSKASCRYEKSYILVFLVWLKLVRWMITPKAVIRYVDVMDEFHCSPQTGAED